MRGLEAGGGRGPIRYDRPSPGCIFGYTDDGRQFEVDMLDQDVPENILKRAAEMAYHRGGGTHPIIDYDIRLARQEINGEADQVLTLEDDNRKLRHEVAALRARLSAVG